MSVDSAIQIAPEAQGLVERTLLTRAADLRQLLARCESPLEQLLAVAMWEHWGGRLSA